jgi:hypothetical protein
MRRRNTVYFNDKYSDTYWIIFTDSEHRFFRAVLKKGFGHVYVLTKDKYNWIILDPKQSALVAQILPISVDNFAPTIISHKHDTILQVEFYKRDNRRHFGFFGFRTCVVMVKYLLGLINHKGFTPYGFFRTLLRTTRTERNMMGIKDIKIIRM